MLSTTKTEAPTTPEPLARIKQPTLLQELRCYTAEPVAAQSAAILSHYKARLWLLASGAAIASTIGIARANPHWLIPIGYGGGSVAVSLVTGAALETAKGKAHQKIATAIELARPMNAIAHSWLTTEQRQLRHFDKLVSQYLFENWLTEHPSTITVPAQPLTGDSTNEQISPHKDLAENPQSCLIGGVPGSGKTLFYLLALAELKQHHPEFRVMLVNPKSSSREAGTAQANAEVRSRNFSEGEPTELAMWLWNCIEEFSGWTGPKLLILDETAAVMGALKLSPRSLQILPKFKSWLTNITSMGDSDRHLVWLVSQDCSCDGLGLSSALRATLRAVALVAPHNRQALRAFISSQWVPLPDGGQQELDSIMDKSPVNRAVFDGKFRQWLPMAKMKNLTGWDRDAGKAVLSPEPLKGPSSAPDEREPEVNYFDIWQSWLRKRTNPKTTVREAQQGAPKEVRVNAAGTREAFKQLERMKIGTFDPATNTFTLATAVASQQQRLP